MPQTVTDLGKLVKQKYPGAYDKMTDLDLGKMVQQKYPGAYDQFSDTPAESRSVTGFLSNVVSSAGKLAGDTASALLHPVDTLNALGEIPSGILDKTLGINTGSKGAQIVDAMLDHFKERYGSLEGVKKTLYEDPIGVLADLATVAGGVGGAAKGVGLVSDAAKAGKAAQVAGQVARTADTVAEVADPLRWGGKAVKATAGKSSQYVGNKLYMSALKPSSNNPLATFQEIAETGRRELLDPTDVASAQKLQKLLADVRAEIETGINQRGNATIDPNRVAARVDQIRDRFRTVNPTGNLRDLDQVKAEFLDQFQPPAPKSSGLLGPNGQPLPPPPAPAPRPLTLREAQDLKTRTNATLNYGEQSAASIEAQKALVRGLKEEIEQIFPEIQGLNERESRFMALEPELDAALKRSLKSDITKVNTVKTLLDNQKVKAKIALGLEKIYQRNPGKFESAGRTVAGRMQIVNSRITNFLDRMNAVQAADPAQ